MEHFYDIEHGNNILSAFKICSVHSDEYHAHTLLLELDHQVQLLFFSGARRIDKQLTYFACPRHKFIKIKTMINLVTNTTQTIFKVK